MFAGKRQFFGLADQILISGSNFVTMVLVGRGLGIAGFGQFSLVYNVLLLANMIQASLVTQPITCSAPVMAKVAITTATPPAPPFRKRSWRLFAACWR